MAKKTQGTGDRSQESVEPATSPALSLDPDYSQETVSQQTPGMPPSLAPDNLVASIAPPAPPQARQGDEGRPYCGTHNCLMRASGTTKTETRYSCPVPLCTQKEKRARSSVSIPREPSRCPDIRCRGKTVESYLEVDLRRSSTAHLCMVCPKCGYDIKVPRPTFNSGVRTYERDEGELAAR